MVRLKVTCGGRNAAYSSNFNSNMVRLKGKYRLMFILPESDFNSNMVRLKVVTEVPPNPPLLLFQFQYGSIKSRAFDN